MTELENSMIRYIRDLIHLYLVAIDNKDRNEINNIYNDNKQYNNIVYSMALMHQLNFERFLFIVVDI